MKSLKKLIINADDYGACEDVNSAVEELALAGLLGGVSLLVNGASFASAVAFLNAHPTINAGIHLNLIEGRPMAQPDAVQAILDPDGLFLNRSGLMMRWALHPIAVTRAVTIEWRTQIEYFLATGLTLTHADSHQHLHAFPPAFRIAVNLCKEFGIPAMRLPRERNRIQARSLTTQALNANLAIAQRFAATASLRCNDHFLGFKRAGAYGLKEILTDLSILPDGVTELALHPSLKNGSPYPTMRGNDERKALLSREFQAQIKHENISLIRWEDV